MPVTTLANPRPCSRERISRGVERLLPEVSPTQTEPQKRQVEFKNRRKSRSRRGNEAEVFFAPKSASLRRRLPCLNTPCFAVHLPSSIFDLPSAILAQCCNDWLNNSPAAMRCPTNRSHSPWATSS